MFSRAYEARLCSALILFSLMFAAPSAQAAFTVEFIPSTQWGQSDALIGLGGGVVEDFENKTLAPGLFIEISDIDGVFTGTGSSALPNLFDPVDGDPYGDTFAEGVWDGTRVLVNTEFNASIYYGSPDWRPVAFYVPEGTAWIAMAAQQVTISHMLWVNGQAVGRLSALGFERGPGRNGVMIVRSDDTEDPVVSVSFGGRGDAFVIDHVVFAAPGSVAGEELTWSDLKALFRD